MIFFLEFNKILKFKRKNKGTKVVKIHLKMRYKLILPDIRIYKAIMRLCDLNIP